MIHRLWVRSPTVALEREAAPAHIYILHLAARNLLSSTTTQDDLVAVVAAAAATPTGARRQQSKYYRPILPAPAPTAQAPGRDEFKPPPSTLTL